MQPQYNVLIIGAGNVGAFFDSLRSSRILTHAHAFHAHNGFNLLGFVDANKNKAQKSASIWGGKAYASIEQAFNSEEIDVASVAVPDELHFDIVKNLLRLPLRCIFLEKPVTKTISEANYILKIHNNKNIPIAVNYSRRFVPEFQKIKENIEKGVYGSYLTGLGTYGKGLIHNGSHLLDLLSYFDFEVKGTKVIKRLADFYKDDKSVSAVLTFKNNNHFYLQTVDCRKYTIFEIELLFEKKKIRIINSGFVIEEYDVRQDDIFKDYRVLFKTKELNTSLGNALYLAVDNIYKHLTKGEDLKCSFEDGYKALKTCITIRDSKN
ncbi:MAG: Gfo/Idh/MocA family oxidoreductase [Thermodesulfovibrionales bacterium]